VGVFTYSAVQGAKANDLGEHVEEDIKLMRQNILLETQAQISEHKLQARVGKRETVMVDELVEGGIIARSKADAPEVDGVIHIHTDNQTLDLGDWIEVEIIAADAHDLEAELV